MTPPPPPPPPPRPPPACFRDGLVLIINPQWQGGNVISDLGFLPWQRKANEELVAGFREVGGWRVCNLEHQKRIGWCAKSWCLA